MRLEDLGRKQPGSSAPRARLFALLLVLLACVLFFPAPSTLAADNAIVTENQLPGSSGWAGTGRYADDVNGQIKGYASATSVMRNGSIALYVSVNPAQTYTVDVYRIGWYQGLGGRFRLHLGPLNGVQQAPCRPDATTGLIDCKWLPSTSLTIPGDWTSGAYVALLTNASGYQNYILFVVRDGRAAALLYQQSVATYQAYNNYPDDGVNGKSLYGYNSYGAPTVSGALQAVKVSFDRPYNGGGAGQFFEWEIQFIRWMERSGYDVTYSTDIDTHENGAALRSSKAFLAVGHDEYWSKAMRDNVEAARDAGVNLGFFTANAVYWQVRFEPSATGVADRVVVCYRDAATDPVQGPTTTVLWRNAPVNRPEQTLMGVQFTSQVNWGSNVPYIVINSGHWVYAGTGLRDGDSVPGILGYEMDRFMPNYPAPTTTNQTLLSQSSFNGGAGPDTANSSVYQAPSGAWVFAAGTSSWSWALDDFGHNRADARMQTATANIMNRFVAGPSTADHLALTLPGGSSATAGVGFSFTVTARDQLGNPDPTYAGTVHFTTSDSSPGVVLPPDATLTNGQGTFSATLIQAGAQSITATDTVTPSISGSVTVQVVPASAAAVTLTIPSSVRMNQPFNVGVTLTDQFGNVATGYQGTMTFTTSDPFGSMPPDYVFTAGDGGSHTFSATLGTPSTLLTPSQTISVTDTVDANLSATSPPITVSAF